MGDATAAPQRYVEIRERMRTLQLPLAPTNESAAEIVVSRSATALDDAPLRGRGCRAFGAWDAAERIATPDKHNIDAQLLFSTDFPYPEGARDPMGLFADHLARFDEATRQRLHVENMRELLGGSVAHV